MQKRIVGGRVQFAAEVRNDLQTLSGRANFSIGYRFARITAACTAGGVFQGSGMFQQFSHLHLAGAGTNAFGSKMK